MVFPCPPRFHRPDAHFLFPGMRAIIEYTMNIYVDLTGEFNAGKRRAILGGGQAVVLHRLAIMSKDGDWILLEEEEALSHILSVLADHGAGYRFGAPLDLRWMRGGWSSHFEFRTDVLRVRTDFVTRPPRLTPEDLQQMWAAPDETEGVPIVSVPHLIELKKTNREKDYVVIGELARLLEDPAQQILSSRSARDLIELSGVHADLFGKLTASRLALAAAEDGEAELEKALDAERRSLIHANEERLKFYMEAAEEWTNIWRHRIASEIENMPFEEAHVVVAAEAEGVLPFSPFGRGD